MRIRSIPVFNEFDTWQSYKPEEPINNMSLYIVEASSFDFFFNKMHDAKTDFHYQLFKSEHRS